MNKKLWAIGLAALAATTTLAVAGCGATLREAAAQEEAIGMATGGYALLGEDGPAGHAHPVKELAAKLGLSEAQKSQVRAIVVKYRSQLRPADWQQRRQGVVALLTAPEVDGAKLAELIRARGAEFEAKRPQRLAMAAELRGVLTPAQRESLAGLIEAGHPQRAAKFDALRKAVRAHAQSALGLTATQNQAIDALAAKVDALRGGPRHVAIRAAAAGFVRTGDTAPLAAATTGLSELIPVDEAVAVATSLDQAQRQQIAAHVRRGLMRRLHGAGMPGAAGF